MQNQARVMLVDDHTLVREGVKSLLDHSRFMVVSEAADGEDAIEKFKQSSPEIVLLDLHMPKKGGLDTAREMMRLKPNARIVFLTMDLTESDMMQALDMSAKGYLLKTSSAESLNRALSLVAEGESVFPSTALKSSMNRMNHGKVDNGLTPREGEILKHLSKGESNKEIARGLDLSEGTVKVHVKSILKKLDMQNRTQAAIYALENNFM